MFALLFDWIIKIGNSPRSQGTAGMAADVSFKNKPMAKNGEHLRS